jgi:hypothetical protein
VRAVADTALVDGDVLFIGGGDPMIAVKIALLSATVGIQSVAVSSARWKVSSAVARAFL